ncbi:hypothetical protein QBC44DRAFT_304230 [Cladorrhinum sp. PSN332]|nr:hypothetical protein QBC44DRAFT_304230 [Cladorrhinum sp. PSN332]
MAVGDTNSGQNDMTPEEIERERQNMMLELGIERVNELTIDDKPNNGDRRRREDDQFYGRHPRTAGRHHNHGNDLIVRGGDLGSVWQAAIESGLFEDDDAAGVKGLDDLGGARLYAGGRGSAQLASNRATNLPHTCHQAQAAPSRQGPMSFPRHAQGPSSRNDQRPCHLGAPKTPRTVNKVQRLLTTLDKNMERPNSQRRVPSTNVRNAINNNAPIPMTRNTNQEVRRPSRAVAAPAALAPQRPVAAPMATNPSAFAANDAFPEPENTVVKVDVQFRPPSAPNHMPSRVFLSFGGPPAYGFFTVAVYGAKFCQWSFATYDDCINGEGFELICLFNHGLGYSLVFQSKDEMVQVYKTLKAHKEKISEAQKLGAVFNAQASKPAQVKKPEQVKPAASPKECSRSSTTAESLPPSREPSKMSGTTARIVAKSTGPVASILAAGSLTSSSEGRRSPEVTNSTALASESKNKLINLEADDYTVASSCAPSEASELLSTLEPYDFVKPEDPIEAFANEVRAMARNFLCVIYASGVAGKTKTEIADTVRVIHQGIIQRFKDDDSLAPEKRQAVEPALSSIFEEYYNNSTPQVSAVEREPTSEPPQASRTEARGVSPQHPPKLSGLIKAPGSPQGKSPVISPTASASGQSSEGSRRTYSTDEMVALRPSAADVSLDWENLDFMPKPGERKALKPTRIESAPQIQPRPGWKPARLAAPASAMDWVMGVENKGAAKVVSEANKEPLIAVDNDQAAVPLQEPSQQPAQNNKPSSRVSKAPAITFPPKPDVGLEKSRWATPSLPIQQANAFTGLRYEKRWKKGSYLYDLAQLDPNIEVNVGAEAIMDLFYPTSDQGTSFRVVPPPSAPCAAAGLVPADTASTSSADHVEHLRRGIERMTIDSQRGTSAASSRRVSNEAPLLSPLPLQQNAESDRRSEATQNPLTGSEDRPLRGLGASRHARGSGPSTSGNFDFVRPKSSHK